MPILKTPSEIAQDYRDYLKGLKPNINADQEDSDWWIRSQVIGGVVGGVYADNLLISNDAHPQQARRDAIAQFLQTYFGDDETLGNFLPATKSQGFVAVTGTAGQVIPAGLQGVYDPNGNTYIVQENTTLDLVAGTGVVPFESVSTGQDQNLNSGAILNIPSPPAGLNPTVVVASGGLSDARDPETTAQARERILARIRTPLSVGRESDYIQYAKDADPSVTSASVQRYPFGLGTVGVYITSGTTDIDAALDNGDAISVIPSDQLIETVQEFLDENRPVTDCVTVMKPSAVEIDVTVQVKFLQGDEDTILTGQTLTQGELVQREVQRAIYKTPVGGRKLGASGYMVASDIEQTIDINLSGEPFEAGDLPILEDRNVLELTVSGYNRLLLPNEVPVPGIINIVSM